MMLSLFSLLPVLLLPATIWAELRCDHIRADGQTFNLEKLGGPKTVHLLENEPPNLHNTTFEIDICKPLEVNSETPKAERCPHGTWICATDVEYRANVDPFVSRVIPIAGSYGLSSGARLDPKVKRLKGSESNSDSELEGVRLELHGGVYKTTTEKVKQSAVIEFICDHEMTGTEGFEDEEKVRKSREIRAAEDDENEDDGDDPEDDLPDLDKGKALQLLSYKTQDDAGVLRLTWKTKYACEDAADKSPDEDDDGDVKKSGSWGFFTWFLIVAFLLAAAYIIFGSWLNYNRYGARGWDLIPHGDTIRDLPYIIKDWASNMMDKLKGGNSRGGYSAVSI